MPRPVPVPIRALIWQLWQRGHTAAQIAEVLSLPPRTVRHLL
jgi:DNA-binding CsgD family transcriptional regulator